MNFKTAFSVTVGFAIAITGCSDSGKETSTAAEKTSKAVAEALTTGVQFKHGLLKRGDIPKADADDVVVKESDPPLELSPGDPALMSLDVENPDDDDPVVATLIQFSGAKDHVEVEAGDDADAGADAGTGEAGNVVTSFTLDDDICDGFCNKKFPIVMFEAIKLKGGKVSKQIKRTFTLDCRTDGDADKCEEAGDDKGGAGKGNDKVDAGSTDEPAGPDAPSAKLTGAMVGFDRASCVTCDRKSQAYCTTAPFSEKAVKCVADAVDDNAKDSKVTGWASCVAAGLTTATKMCGQLCNDEVSCSPATFDTAAAACNELPEAAQTAIDECMLVPDAGTAAP